ncbi:MAG TPA: Maf family protein [Dehalococcoidia bacterium]|nr:Maf family protein [Dehalococcoidia bacterium]
MPALILASASPRRSELLARLGVPFEVRPVSVIEDVDSTKPAIVASRLARMKAEAARLADAEAPVLAADTVVVHEGAILGKPRDAAEAREMLRRLRGQSHRVITAVAVIPRGGRAALLRHPETEVTMRRYTDEEIAASIARGDPFDKAGAYAIQDPLLRPVGRYQGCYCNVVGLPLWTTVEMLRRAGLDITVTADSLLPQCAACPLRPLV